MKYLYLDDANEMLNPSDRSLPPPTDEEIESAMRGNLCRCMTYPRVNKAIRAVVDNADITEV